MSEWIRVKDRLPFENQTVLLVSEIHLVGGFINNYICMAYYEDGCWYEIVQNGDEDIPIGDFPTHWMPLPEPPKEEDNE